MVLLLKIMPCEAAKIYLLTDIKQTTIKKVDIEITFLNLVAMLPQDRLMDIMHHLNSTLFLIEADLQFQIFTEIEADHHMISNVLQSNETLLSMVVPYLITHQLIQSRDDLDLH